MAKKECTHKEHALSFKYLLFDFMKWSGWPLFVWFRPKKIYESKEAKEKIKGGVIIAGNHINFDDIMLWESVMWNRRLHFGAMKELFDRKFVAFFLKTCLCIPVDRENFSMQSMRVFSNELKAGHAVFLFPQGKINVDNNFDDLKEGPAFIALSNKVPILPVYRGKRKHWYSREKVIIGEKIDTVALANGKMNKESIDLITNELKNRLNNLKSIYNKIK